MTELSQLASQLAASAVRTTAAVRPVVARTALETKNRMRQEAAGHRHAPRLRDAIDYDLVSGGMGFECGPRKDPPGGGRNSGEPGGSLAFYYFGNSKVNASIPDPVIALNDEAEKAEQYIAEAVARVIL